MFLNDGTRPYELPEAEPLPTSHGEDTYRRIFDRRDWTGLM